MNPDKFPSALSLAFHTKQPVMIWGAPGVGKSSVVKQVAGDREVHDIRLALLDPTDLRGIPYYSPETKSAQWAPASMLPQNPNSTAIIFLDEINAAPPSIQASAYQLVLDRRIGDYYLPDGVDIVAAGNREGDRGVTFRMPTPLLNRFTHLDYDVSFDAWYDWAVQESIHPGVIAYIKYNTDSLMEFDPKSKSRGFATPRSWHFVSNYMEMNQKVGVTENILYEMMKGTIGEGQALKFKGHMKVVDTLPDPADILSGKVKVLDQKTEISAQYSLMIALGQRLKVYYNQAGGDGIEKTDPAAFKKWCVFADNYFEYIHDQFKDEFCVMGVRDCFKGLKLPMARCDVFKKKFVKKYGHLIMRA